MLVKIIRFGRSPSLTYIMPIGDARNVKALGENNMSSLSMILTIKFHHRLLYHRLELTCKTYSTLMSRKIFFANSKLKDNFKGTILIPCLLSTSINEVSAVPLTVHSSTGAAKFPTWRYYEMYIQYWLVQ